MEDLRSWLEEREKAGDLKKCEGLDWNLEIGYLTALNWTKEDAPALLFDNIKDYPAGFRVLTGSVQTRSRVASVLNVPLGKSNREQLQIMRERIPAWEANLEKFAPVTVESGPILQNIRDKEEVDILQFPTPLWHDKDGGRYIGTGDAVITRDPDTGAVNIGAYRVMVHDRRTAGLFTVQGRHGNLHLAKYHAQGKPCPVAVSVGHHPLIFTVAGEHFPAGTEYNYIGAIRGQPEEVITEEITGLPIPSHSEIVMVGWCWPGKTKVEGPFGEFTGYYGSGARPSPFIEVERIYYRNDPIMLGSPPGRPPNETSLYHLLVHSANLHNRLEKAGVPEVTGVCVHELSHFLIAVSIKQRYAGHAKQTALLVSELSTTGGPGAKYVIVVDEDIDVTNLQEVMWAVVTRTQPSEDLDIIRNARGNPLDPSIRRPAEAFFTSRVIIDACRPFAWIDKFPEVVEFSPEVRKKMAEKLGDG